MSAGIEQIDKLAEEFHQEYWGHLSGFVGMQNPPEWNASDSNSPHERALRATLFHLVEIGSIRLPDDHEKVS